MGILSVILMILKILAITIGAILGLLIIVFLLVLFVPFRYRISGSKKEEISVIGRITWLLHVIGITCSYNGAGRPRIRAKLFGICIYDNTKPRTKRKKRKKRKTTRTQKQKPPASALETDEKAEPATGRPELTDSKAETLPGTDVDSYDENNAENDRVHAESVWTRVYRYLIGLWKKICNFVAGVVKLVRTLQYRVFSVKDFLQEESNKTGFNVTIKALKKFIAHMKPRKLKGTVIFGTGDPSSTGYILAGIGVLYGKLGPHFNIQPDFETAIAEGEVIMKGRVCLARMLYLFLRLWYNKEFIVFKDNITKLKDDLKREINENENEKETQEMKEPASA